MTENVRVFRMMLVGTGLIFAAGMVAVVCGQPGQVESVRILPICTYRFQEWQDQRWWTVKEWSRRCDGPSGSTGSTTVSGCARIVEVIP